MSAFVYIPENSLGILPGYLTRQEFVELLRELKNEPEAIQFLADMLEE